MAARVSLTADVDPEVKKRVKPAADDGERDVYSPAPGESLHMPDNPIRLRGAKRSLKR